MRQVSKVWLLGLCLMLLLVEVNSDCSGYQCAHCNASITNKEYIQTCTSCQTGYTLNDSNICTSNIGLIIIVSILAFVTIILQIVCFCLCNMHFKKLSQKKTEFTLDEVLEFYEKQKKQVKQQKQIIKQFEGFMYQKCQYCKKFPDSKQAGSSSEANNNPLQINIKRQNGGIQEYPGSSQNFEQLMEKNKDGPNCLLKCGHYYHLKCLHKYLKKTQDKACLCGQNSFVPIRLICVQCRLKDRHLDFNIKQKSILDVRPYTCAVCYKKVLEQQQKKKWWKKVM